MTRKGRKANKPRFRTLLGAKRNVDYEVNRAYYPVIVKLKDGGFDAYPKGQRIPKGAEIVSRWMGGSKGWVDST